MAAGGIGRAAAQTLSAAAAGTGWRPERAGLIEREAGHIVGDGRETDSANRAPGGCGSDWRWRNASSVTGRLDGSGRTCLSDQTHVAHV